MKDILALTKAIADVKYYEEMFERWGEDKNILFVSPQSSGRHLYKSILPFFCLRDDRTSTAITSLKRFNSDEQLLGFEIDITDEMVDWADFIVFPFTTQPLVEEIYKRIKELSPETVIVFTVDFNFYELSEKHPYKEIFKEENVINDVEDNMFFADLVFVNNVALMNYIVDKFKELLDEKYLDIESGMMVACMPLFTDSEIVLKNVDYDLENTISVKPETIHTPKINELIEKTTEAAEIVKKEDKKRIEEEVSKNEKEEKNTNSKKVIENGKHTTAKTGKSTNRTKPTAKSGKSDKPSKRGRPTKKPTTKRSAAKKGKRG